MTTIDAAVDQAATGQENRAQRAYQREDAPALFAEQFLEEPVYEGASADAYLAPTCTLCTFRGIPLIDDAH